MSESNYQYFNLLKNEIVITMQRSYPGINLSISDWKKQEITDFQEDLRIKVNGQISEKWFYTHMKSDKSTLPRIDLLNLLSKYAGYSNWDDFIFQHKGKIPVKSSDDAKIEKEIRDLKYQLSEEVTVENFEVAAKLRDTIKKLQKKLYIGKNVS